MGILKVLKDAANRQMRIGTQAAFYPRGLAYPLEEFTTGKIRFGRKIGFPFPIIAPDNRFQLDEDAIFGVSQIEIDRIPDWIDFNSFISIGERELHRVIDVVDTTLVLSTPLLADHLEGQFIYHYSNPIEVEGAFLAGQDTIVVDSQWLLVRGDVIAISPKADQIIEGFIDVEVQSFREYVVEDLVFVSLIDGIYQYQLVLDKTIHRDLADEEEIQLRAYPAYQSKILGIPTSTNPQRRISGPFLIDWMSGPFVDNLRVEEIQTIQRYTKARTPIGVPIVIEKNHQILQSPIRADQFLFWDKVEGDINYNDFLGNFICKLNEDGDWWLKYTAVPNIEVPSTNPGGTISTPLPSAFSDNESFILDDSEDAIRFEYKVTSGYVATAESAASGSITVAGPPPFPADNDSFTLDDGFGNVVTFEYERTASFALSAVNNYPINIISSSNVTDIVIATANAINAVSFLKISASNASPNVSLTHDVVSQRGNQPIVLDANLTGLGWSSVGMSGGTNDVETIDISSSTTALEVAQLTAAAVNRQRLKIIADFPTSFPAFRLRNSIPGTAGNIPIVETVSDLGFVVTGMSGGSGGTSWHFQMTPDQNCLVRVRLYPNDFQDYNLTANVAGTIVVALNPTDDPIERIDLIINGSAGGEVLMTDWNINGNRVGAIQHEYVARVQGEHNYSSTTLMVKQLFQSLDDLKLKLDTDDRLDAGLLVL